MWNATTEIEDRSYSGTVKVYKKDEKKCVW